MEIIDGILCISLGSVLSLIKDIADAMIVACVEHSEEAWELLEEILST
ncbi:MAG: hypothetical protein IJ661_04015 [Lachnospiraceae bacterium]|nr:hypothetical protein [Lachnospiraceae bacterium]